MVYAEKGISWLWCNRVWMQKTRMFNMKCMPTKTFVNVHCNESVSNCHFCNVELKQGVDHLQWAATCFLVCSLLKHNFQILYVVVFFTGIMITGVPTLGFTCSSWHWSWQNHYIISLCCILYIKTYCYTSKAEVILDTIRIYCTL